jgi:16S rRNA (uracil1498-N3)-methyltransferase
MVHRFFTTESLASNDIVLTNAAQVHQLTRVLRMDVGDTFVLNEGNGEDVAVVITGANKKELHVRVTARTPAWVPQVAVHVVLATIRKERFEWALEKCTELGATSITPLVTERSERGAVSLVRAAKIVQEAAEQCGRGNVPRVGEVQDVAAMLAALQQSNALVLACVHTGAPLLSALSAHGSDSDLGSRTSALGSCSILIGPEGGWTPHELELSKKHSVVEVSLGPTNLRAETAAVAEEL